MSSEFCNLYKNSGRPRASTRNNQVAAAACGGERSKRKRSMSATYAFARPQTAVGVLLFTGADFWERPGNRAPLGSAIISRDRKPIKGQLPFPGTVMRIGPDDTGAIDDTDLDAASRVLKDKLGIKAPHLEQLYTWFTRDVDPRGATTVIAYFAVVPFDHFRDAPPERVQFMPVDELPRLAFNHNEIIRRGVE